MTVLRLLFCAFLLSLGPLFGGVELQGPIRFKPLLMERIWGGREMERYNKELPDNALIGESWEIADRPEAQSIVLDGPLKGKSLHELWMEHREEVFGDISEAPRFPILVKLIDAREKLSVQVHPNAEMAKVLSGEPKTEMWYFVETYGDGDIFAGLKRGVTFGAFAKALAEGRVADLIHRQLAFVGEAFFIPSGRIHALGGGNLIVEVQQNSDTTYRVFDWNRPGLNGKPRPLHISESLQCIDFSDFEPGLIVRDGDNVASCPYFSVKQWHLEGPRKGTSKGVFTIVCCISCPVSCCGVAFHQGDFFLIPASLEEWDITPLDECAAVIMITL